MSTPGPEIKRWTAKRKTQLVLEILKGKTTVAEAARCYDLKPSEIQSWVDEGIKGIENSLRARPRDIRSNTRPNSRRPMLLWARLSLRSKS